LFLLRILPVAKPDFFPAKVQNRKGHFFDLKYLSGLRGDETNPESYGSHLALEGQKKKEN
jgi:hypothetical protein